MRRTTTHHDTDDEELLGILAYILLVRIDQMETHIMATLSDVLADDAQLEGEVAQIITTLTDVEAQLAALQTSGLTPEQQAQVDQVATSLSTLNANITAALPAPPTP